MDTSGLQQFIQAAKQEGASDQLLVELLRQRGWPEKEIYAAFTERLERLTGTTMPARRTSWESAKDAFLYLLSFSTLGTWAMALGTLWFTLIEVAYPDVLYAGYLSSTSWSLSNNLAAMLIAFPVYLYAMRLIRGELIRHPEKRDSGVRRWLTYIALLMAAGIVIGDLITFLSYFFHGELSVRFALKVLAVMVIAGGILWYYLAGLQSGVIESRERSFTAGATAMVVAAMILGFVQLGSPAQTRAATADTQRSKDLEWIARKMHVWWLTNGQSARQLPLALPDLGTRTLDPITKQPYRYSALGDSRYQLCATFFGTGDQTRANPEANQFATHPPGMHCFTLDAALAQF